MAQCLRTSFELELLENMVDMMLDRRHAQARLSANLLVRQSLAEQR